MTLAAPTRRRSPKQKKFVIGPEHDGQRVSLADFDQWPVKEGYKLQNVGTIAYMGGCGEAKLLVGSLESERHPDWTVYQSHPPEHTKKVWRLWVPEIVVEVVSKSSAPRDYDEKPQEYLDFGVKEYWIVDAFKKQMTVLQRYGGQWKKKIVKPGDKYTTVLLPKFSFDLKKVLAVKK